MKSLITPTVTAANTHLYREQMERIMKFATRIHVDFADGEFAPTMLVSPQQAWLPQGYVVDMHVMYQQPADVIEDLISLKPNMIILHAEADGNILGLLREVKSVGIKAGLALLQNTQPEEYAIEIDECDHVLLFGGSLGYHGGVADLSVLNKIGRIREINPMAELGWDGGVNEQNVSKISEAGISAINVGGFIHKADNPKDAYAILESVIN